MRKFLAMIMIILALLMSSCGLASETKEVQNGDYVLQIPEKASMPLPNINLTDGNFTFSYDVTSSYLPVGHYEVKEGILELTTDDSKYHYKFELKGDSLFFIESESSSVKLIDSNLGVQILDDAEFKMSK